MGIVIRTTLAGAIGGFAAGIIGGLLLSLFGWIGNKKFNASFDLVGLFNEGYDATDETAPLVKSE